MDLIAAIVEDAIDDALGTARGRWWTLALVTTAAAVAAGVWVSRRGQRHAPARLVRADLDAA